MKVPLGLGGLRMSIEFERVEERPLEFASMKAKGKGVGALMNMTTSFSLSGEGGTTSMAWEADVRIAGPVGSMGQQVLQPIVNQQVGQVLSALETRVASARWFGLAVCRLRIAAPVSGSNSWIEPGRMAASSRSC